jgi:hypothetical protein
MEPWNPEDDGEKEDEDKEEEEDADCNGISNDNNDDDEDGEDNLLEDTISCSKEEGSANLLRGNKGAENLKRTLAS